MKGVIYARYSSDNQREESIEGQIRECKAFAEKNGIDIIEIYVDRALSAKTDNRPDFQRLIKESGSKKFEVLLVWKLDRFARNKFDSAHYKRILKNNGVHVVSATEIISDGPEGILLESLLEGMAEYYSADLSEKVMRGQTENALKCMYNGGTLPIGYVVDKEQHFQIDPVAAPLVLQAFTDYSNGKSMCEVTDMLNLAGVRTKRGGKVSINSVTRMLHNRRYIGEYQYRDIVHPHGIPAIIPEDLFERVQERLAKTKKAPAKFKAEDEYLLTTKLFCGKCNCYMAGESGTSHTGIVHRYYKCVSVKNHKGCDKKSVQKEWIENLVIDRIKRILFDDEMIEKLADMGMERQRKENTVLPMLKRQLAETEKGIRNFVDAIQQGIITESTKERLEGLERTKKELSAQIAREELLQPPEFTRDQFLFWFVRMRRYDTTKLAHRRRLIDSFVNAIYLYDDRITLVFNFKDGTKTITIAELEESGLGSDINALATPSRAFITDSRCGCPVFFISKVSPLIVVSKCAFMEDSKVGYNKTIQMCIFEGNPNGRILCELSNWDGRIYKISRSELNEFSKRDDSEYTGIYFLFGKNSDNDETIYIGEAEKMLTRLKQHLNDDDYWNDCVVVLSKDNKLNKAHVKYLENSFYTIAKEANRSLILNNTVPTRSSISEFDESMLIEFIDNTRLLVNTLGYKSFERFQQKNKTEIELFSIVAARGASATGYLVPDGFTVCQGSRVATNTAPSMSHNLVELRSKLMNKGIINDAFVFTVDYVFSSPSLAAAVVMGRNANGRTEWKTNDRKTINMLEEQNSV